MPGKIGLAAKAPLLANGTVPPEVRKLLTTLRTQPFLKSNFPNTEITGIRPTEGTDGKQGSVDFTIVCQPAGAKGAGGKNRSIPCSAVS